MRLFDVGRVLHGPADAEGWLAGKQLFRKRPASPGGQAELDPSMCACSVGHQHPGL